MPVVVVGIVVILMAVVAVIGITVVVADVVFVASVFIAFHWRRKVRTGILQLDDRILLFFPRIAC